MDEDKVKILMAKPGLEGHWRGIMAVSSAFRDAGYEVVYGGNYTLLNRSLALVLFLV